MRRWLIVGLGNPGARYAGTRHNLGFRVVERMGEKWGAAWQTVGQAVETGWFLLPQCEGVRVKLLKPLTYMNRSGNAVRETVRRESLAPYELLVVCDDVHLPFGKLRIRLKGSDGGHNGLASVIAALGTEEFPRLRIGIGSDFAPGEMVAYVLSDFRPEEERELPEVIERAVEAAAVFVCEGPEKAMTLYNR
ncbi:MAG: aminoacyl-tRNA hydrolase [candidate division KSB1 bacterium]|nr:aminoacyl-tRNA hydrolase [candidate division KSB1 bacterium]